MLDDFFQSVSLFMSSEKDFSKNRGTGFSRMLGTGLLSHTTLFSSKGRVKSPPLGPSKERLAKVEEFRPITRPGLPTHHAQMWALGRCPYLYEC